MILTNKIFKYILIAVLLFLSSVHIQKIIFVGIGLNQVTLFVSACLGIAVLKESKTLYSWSFYLFGLFYILTAPDVNLSGVAPFFLALVYFNNIKMIAAISTGLPTFLILNFFIYERLDFYNLPILIFGNLGLISLLYLTTIKKPSQKVLSTLDQKKVLLHIQGKTPEEIIKELNLSVQPRTVRTFILDQVKKSHCQNESQFAVNWCKMNKIDIETL